MKRIAIAFGALLLCGAAPVDWKFVGEGSIAGRDGTLISVHSFMLESDITWLPDHHAQVWTKSIAVSDADKASLDKEGIKRAAAKYVRGYRPPLATLKNATKDQVIDVLILEEQADGATIEARSQILFELDCAAKLIRDVSVSIHNGNQIGKSDTPGQWAHIPPESMGANLMTMVCG